MHLKNKNSRFKLKKSNILVITIAGIILIVFLMFKVINKKISPILISYAETETRKMITYVINKVIGKEFNETIETKELFIINKDEYGKIETIDYNSKIVNSILIEASTIVHSNLKNIVEGNIKKIEIGDSIDEFYKAYDKKNLESGIIYKIPMGVIFKNPFLSNLGPSIPVRFNLAGDISTNLSTEIKSFGINNAMLESYLCISINVDILLPITTKKIEVTSKTPIVIKIIEGEIPKYYQNGYNQNSSILSLPVE